MYKIFFIFIILLSTLFSKDKIEIYNCYGNEHEIVIEGRNLKKSLSIKFSYDDNWIKNLWYNTKLFKSNDIEDAHIVARIDKKDYQTKSDEEGYFNFDINLSKPLRAGYYPINLKLKNDSVLTSCNTLVISSQKYVGIISDFDDTVIISNVNQTIKLLNNTFLKNYKQRSAIPAMKEKFETILAKNPPKTPSIIFFITGSPKQITSNINDFLDYHNFPKRVIISKEISDENIDRLPDQFTYKLKKIEYLIKFYPNIKWYLFGDNSEKDKEVYLYIRKKYPRNIEGIFIRDIKTGKIENIGKKAHEYS